MISLDGDVDPRARSRDGPGSSEWMDAKGTPVFIRGRQQTIIGRLTDIFNFASNV